MKDSHGPLINRECPCRTCTERHEACHGSCVRYIEWKNELARNNHVRWKEEQRYKISETKLRWITRKLRRDRK